MMWNILTLAFIPILPGQKRGMYIIFRNYI